MHAIQRRLDHLAGCAWFWLWAVVGFGVALARISLGPLLLLPALAIGVRMALDDRARESAFGLLTGAGALCLLVAWIQRSGDVLDPWPWLAAGIVLAVAGLAGHAIRSQRAG
jgi:hypothetical protein